MTLQLHPEDQGNRDVPWHTGATRLSPETSAPIFPQLLYIPCKQDELSLTSEEHPTLQVGEWDGAGALSPATKHPLLGPRQGRHPRDSCNSMLSQNSLAGPLMHCFVCKGLGVLGGALRLLNPLLKFTTERINLHQRRQFPEDRRM